VREIEPIFVAVSIDEKSTKNAKINLSHHTPSSTFCSVFLTGKPIQKGRHFEKPALNKANQSNQFEHFSGLVFRLYGPFARYGYQQKVRCF